MFKIYYAMVLLWMCSTSSNAKSKWHVFKQYSYIPWWYMFVCSICYPQMLLTSTSPKLNVLPQYSSYLINQIAPTFKYEAKK